jgi:hypothetical protein
LSLPGLTRQSITLRVNRVCPLARTMDTRVKPAYDTLWDYLHTRRGFFGALRSKPLK